MVLGKETKLIKLYPYSKIKREVAQRNKIRYKREGATEATEIQRITIDYYEL